MAQVRPKRLSPDTLGTGVLDLHDFQKFSPEQGVVMPVYGDQDLRLTMWNLEPGQENSTHIHHDYSQTVIVLEGSGVVLKGENIPPVPIKAGQWLIAPRGVAHGIQNTGTERMTYLSISKESPEGFQREPIGEQKVKFDNTGS